ncbi:MAG: TetR/AcrR family transcriptional regulator [Candidatus Nitrospinota bacterium M3_3B_026]
MKKAENREPGAEKAIAVADHIIEAAAGEFAAKGFAGARVDEIARLAGVNKAAIYYHVGDKEALYKAALKRVAGPIAERVGRLRQEGGAADEKLRALIGVIAENILSSEFFSPIILREIASGGASAPKDILELMGKIISSVRSVLAEGEAEGRFRRVDPLVTHLMIVGGLNFLAARSHVFRKIKSEGFMEGDLPVEQSAGAIAQSVADIILDGVRRKG